MESVIDSRLVYDGSVVEYRTRLLILGFSQAKGVDLDDTLASRSSQREEVDL